jgi:hypothetical protein
MPTIIFEAIILDGPKSEIWRARVRRSCEAQLFKPGIAFAEKGA